MKFTYVINKDAKKSTYEEVRENAIRFIRAGYNSEYIKESQRVEWLVKWKIFTTPYVLSPKVKKAVRTVTELLANMERED